MAFRSGISLPPRPIIGPFIVPVNWAIEHVQSPLAKSVLQGRLCSLSSGNVLNIILDVREWETTRDRQQLEPVFRRTVATDRGNWLIRAA